ncbi:MAG: MFS transporter [Gemmataceae bacterium]|nr:MFS transporter [Gemmataceae bacterium]
MSYSTAPASSPSFSDKMLFWASFFTLIAAGIGFSVRTEILGDWGQQFGFTQSELGAITGGGLFLFGVSIILLSFIADWIGYGKLMTLAFLLHASSAVVTFAATPVFAAYGKEATYWCLNIGMYLFALGNGTCEAVINPLTATLFPRNKTHWLNILHAGWPGGLILGALIALGFNQIEGGIRWEYKLGVFLVPVLLYGVMMVGRRFPTSEAKEQGVNAKEMMGEVGMLGAAVAIFFVGLMLTSVVIPGIPKSWIDIPTWVGWAIALGLWIIYGFMTEFSFGHLVLAFLYLLHAMVGYVELGTDSWITNITNTVLANKDLALLAFIWTNLLMFGLRFFAGPIVHQINPVGLLFVSAVIATAGLWMLGQPFTGTAWAWLGAVTVYGIGKTFYWPTLLGTISERFPKGGALALGFSGGIGMLSAGLLGSSGIGYKQDFFAVQNLSSAPDTYQRYMSRDEDGKPNPKGFPLVSELLPEQVPPVAGLDNSKLGVFDDYGKVLADQKKGKSSKTTLESDLDTLHKVKAAGGKVEPKLEQNLTGLMNWWQIEAQPNYETDKPKLNEARLYGGKQALLYTAAVPAAMAVGFLLLILFFAATGGYKQVHIGDRH